MAPLVSVIKTLYYVAIIFHHQVWYRTFSVRHASIQSSALSSSPRLPLCQILFIRNLHRWASPCRKIAYSITQLPSLSDALWTEALRNTSASKY